jgi:hypothetical protein
MGQAIFGCCRKPTTNSSGIDGFIQISERNSTTMINASIMLND